METEFEYRHNYNEMPCLDEETQTTRDWMDSLTPESNRKALRGIINTMKELTEEKHDS